LDYVWSRSPRPATSKYYQVITADEMYQLFTTKEHGPIRIRLTGPLQLPHRDLPIDPYLVGLWLGGGRTNGGEITAGAADVKDLVRILTEREHTVRTREERRTTRNGSTSSTWAL